MSQFVRLVVREVTEWTDAMLSSIPGRVGIALRAHWARVRFNAAGRVSIETGCCFHGVEAIEFVGNASIGARSFFAASGGRILVAANVYFNRSVHINASVGGCIRIGENCLIGPNVVIRTAGHCFDRLDVPIRSQGHKILDINIGTDCWIGANAVILGGVSLGNGVVVAAGSVVTRDVPANTVVAGVPAKTIRSRGEPEIESALNSSRA
jgi:galactoside O-acetyltransferase